MSDCAVPIAVPWALTVGRSAQSPPLMDVIVLVFVVIRCDRPSDVLSVVPVSSQSTVKAPDARPLTHT